MSSAVDIDVVKRKLEEPWSAFKLSGSLTHELLAAIRNRLDDFSVTETLRIMMSVLGLQKGNVKELR
jgi:hypothetical protein